MKKGKKIWNRLLSLVLCLVMVTGVFAGMGMEAKAATSNFVVYDRVTETYPTDIEFYVTNDSGERVVIQHGEDLLAKGLSRGKSYNLSIKSNAGGYEVPTLRVTIPASGYVGNVSSENLYVYKMYDLEVTVVDAQGNLLNGKIVNITHPGGNATGTTQNGQCVFTNIRGLYTVNVSVPYEYDNATGSVNLKNKQSIIITIPAKRKITANVTTPNGTAINDVNFSGVSFSESNGSYTAIVDDNKAYDVTASARGFESKNFSIASGSDDASVSVSMSVVAPKLIKENNYGFQSYYDWDRISEEYKIGDSLKMNMGTSKKLHVWKGGIPSNGTITWSSSNANVFTVADGNLVPTGVGSAVLTVTSSYGGSTNSKTVTIEVDKGETTYPSAPIIEGANINKTQELFVLPDALKGANKLTVKATGAANKEQEFTNLIAGQSVTMDFENVVHGNVKYEFTYTSNNYNYTDEKPSAEKDYYITKPFSVSFATNGESLSAESLVYGDTRILSIVVNEDGITNENITYKLKVTDGQNDVLSSVDGDKVSNTTTILDDIKVANAGSTTITVNRPEIGAPYYWAEASASVSVDVAKKVIDPLKATYSRASDEAAIYDGKKDYKAIGALDLSELVPGDTPKAQLSTTLVLPSADADTYNADTDEIQIGNVGLKATIWGNQAELDRNYELKVTAPTTAIEKSGDLEINKKEINPLLPNYQKDDSEVGIYDGEKTYKVVGTVEAADGDTNGKLIVADAGKARITATLELPSDDAGTYKASSGTIAIGDAIALVAVDDKDAEHIAKNYVLKSVNCTDKIEKSKDLVVTPKEIKPLVAVTYANASERVYDGTNIIEAVGTVGTYSDGGKAKDMDDVSVNATLSIIGKDVGTYTPSNEVIRIKKYALSGADAKNYKLPETIPTGKIETSGTSLIIKERPVTVSGFTADDKDYDQSTVATLSSNNVVVANIVNGENLNVTAKGTFTDKNVERDGSGEAINKTVNISDIALSDGTNGKASNYVLTASGNQESTTATIRPIEAKVLVTVNDKQYDGLNTATIKDAGLDGIINGDIVTLNRGTPKFNGVGEADNEQTIGISFTDFSIEGADAVNYDVTQPTGVTAKIYNDYDAKKDIDYIVNSNDWINEDFVVTAAEGHVISEADDYDGANTWNERLSRSEDITDGELKFYVRDNESGAISKSVIETYNIDTILPTGSVKIAENKWMEFWNNITFEKFFNKTQTVTITADDERSGVAKVEYYESDKELTLDEIKALRDDDWTKGEKVRVTLEDTKKFVYYARITDKAGNVNYLNTDGSVYDTKLPTLKGAKEGEVYYTTQTITVKDTNLATITLDGETVTSTVTLPGNVDKVYKLVAIDKAGNKAALSISMKPLSDLSGDITDSNVTLADEKELEKSEELLKNELEKGNLSDEEKKDVKDRLTEIQNLLQDIDEVKDVIKMLDNLPDAYLEDGETINPYVSDRMDDEEQKLYSAVKAAYKAYNKLSAHQQSLISTGLKHNLSNLRKVLTDYRITDGDGKVWVYDTNGTLTFTANGPVCRFENALVDGKKVPAEEMKVTKGSTVVELDAGYLYRLGLGDHTFQMEYTDGETDVVEFSIVTMEVWNTMMKQSSGVNKTGGVATGDSANIFLWGAVLAVGATGMVVAKKRRKDEEA